jgi:hypothetical protein
MLSHQFTPVLAGMGELIPPSGAVEKLPHEEDPPTAPGAPALTDATTEVFSS